MYKGQKWGRNAQGKTQKMTPRMGVKPHRVGDKSVKNTYKIHNKTGPEAQNTQSLLPKCPSASTKYTHKRESVGGPVTQIVTFSTSNTPEMAKKDTKIHK